MNLFGLFATIIIYLAVVGYLAYIGFRRSKTAKDYMVAGRSAHPYIMAMSYGATFISTSAIVGFGGIASIFGMPLLWLTFFNVFIGIFIAFTVFGKRTRRIGLNLDAHTFPELLGRRLDSRFVQWFTGLIIFIFMPLYASAVLIGAARIIESFMQIDYMISVIVFSILIGAYVILGGLKSVMYTDALQGTLMFFGMLILLIFTYNKLGGFTPAHQALTNIADMVPESMVKAGHQGWTRSPAGGSPYWWVVYSSIVLGVGIGTLAQPQLAVRFMTVRSNKEINRAILIGGIFIFMTVGTAFIVGSLSNVYFAKEAGTISIAMAKGNADSVIPTYINAAMPKWFIYPFMLVILSAAMSTLSSQFHTIGTSISRDFLENGILKGKKIKSQNVVLITRIAIVISLLVTVALSLVISEASSETGFGSFGKGIIARATAIFFGLMASCFLAPYVGSIFFKKFTKTAAIWGILSGFVVTAFGFLFLHGSEARVFRLSEALTGKETLFAFPWPVVDPMVYALPVSIIVTVVVGLITAKGGQASSEKAFKGL